MCRVRTTCSEQFANRLKEKTFNTLTKLKHPRAWKSPSRRTPTLAHSTLFLSWRKLFSPYQTFPLRVWKKERRLRSTEQQVFRRWRADSRQTWQRRQRRATGEPGRRPGGRGRAAGPRESSRRRGPTNHTRFFPFLQKRPATDGEQQPRSSRAREGGERLPI